MSYADHFRLADELIQHLDLTLAGVNDPFLESRYTGFLAVSSVTVLELALKTIFNDFASSKHLILGNFCSQYFERINGRLGLDIVRKDYITKFGVGYLTQFKQDLENLEIYYLRTNGFSVKSSYSNLLTWRNQFAHEGTIPATATYTEVKKAYECGKIVMQCLAGCMTT